YDVGYGNELLKNAARDRDCDIVLYGHTHVPEVEYGDICVANPGSFSRPRQDGGRKTYMLLEFDQHDKPFFNVNYL
ncbi:MAG: metallophosphoesterase family protein, partial [Lachnospiraceae bacterium]|nr:metallophosphoesterase family protein [Lachnospiraceae bacterium]